MRIALAALFLLAGSAEPSAEARRSSSVAPIVVVDAGHGGKDEGAIVHGKLEKRVVLNISKRFHQRMVDEGGLRPYMTRWDDEFVALSERVLRADAVRGKAFVSIHADNVRRRRGRGVVVYVYGRNDSIPDGPPREKGEKRLPKPPKRQIQASKRLAETIRRTFKKHGIKTAPYVDRGRFAVLKSREMPSVLIEVGNLRDRKESALIHKPAHQQRLAKALSEAVRKFLAAEGHIASASPPR